MNMCPFWFVIRRGVPCWLSGQTKLEGLFSSLEVRLDKVRLMVNSRKSSGVCTCFQSLKKVSFNGSYMQAHTAVWKVYS